MGSRWPSVARAMRGAMVMGRGVVESITVVTALRAVPDGARAAGGLYSFPTPLFCGLRGLAGSVALGQGGGRGRGGGRNGGGRAPPGKTTVALLSARGQAEVEKVLKAARVDGRLLNMLIRDVGGMYGREHEQKLDWLWEWTKTQPSVKVNVRHCNAFITQLGRRRRLQDALDMYVYMKKAGLQPDVVTYSAMVDACAKSAQLELARKVFEEMKAAGVEPNLKVYSTMISACEKGKQWELAREVFEEMKVAGGEARPQDVQHHD